ncbi:hypothetical protein [Niallia sp. Krafla_26]
MNKYRENADQQNDHSIQDEAMKRANQRFNKIKQEVQEMIQKNEHSDPME